MASWVTMLKKLVAAYLQWMILPCTIGWLEAAYTITSCSAMINLDGFYKAFWAVVWHSLLLKCTLMSLGNVVIRRAVVKTPLLFCRQPTMELPVQGPAECE